MSMRRAFAIGGRLLCSRPRGARRKRRAAREVLEQAAAAMGGLERLQSLDNLVMTGFGQYINQQGGSAPSPDPRAPYKWTVAHDAERFFDLRNGNALNRDRRGSLFPFAIEQPWDRTSRVQTGVAALDHPVPALLEALDAGTRLGPVSVEDGLTVVQFTLAQGPTVWLAVDPGDEAAGVGALDRPEHDARRPHDDDLLHGLLAVRRLDATGRHHGRDGLARPDVDDVPRRFVSLQRGDAGVPGGCGRRRRPPSAAPRRRRSRTRSGTCASAATAAPSSSSPITS